MNCDQVFEILTRGPFPTGGACDHDVEEHLSQCVDCHRLAEALRPALELFQEAIGPEESRDLPGYWCAVATDRKPPVLSMASAEQPPQVALPEPLSGEGPRISVALTLWRMAAMLALGVTLGTLFAARGGFDNFSRQPPVVAGASQSGDDWPLDNHAHANMVGPLNLAHLSKADRAALAVLPAACMRHRPGNGPRNSLRGDQLLATADLSGLTCCSECHHANSETVPKSATASVAQRCHLCHNESSRQN